MPVANLYQLRSLVAAVCPINGVDDLGDGAFAVRYLATATTAQLAAAQAIVNAWPVTSTKITQATIINAAYLAAIAAGFSVTLPTGPATFAIDSESRDLYRTILATQPTGNVTVYDTAGVAHTVTVAQFLAAATAIQKQFVAWKQNLNAKLSAITVATTVAAVQAITF